MAADGRPETVREPVSFGLFTWLVPSRTDLALHEFILSCGVQLGDAGGDVLKWQVCENQRQADAIYENQRTEDQAAIDFEEGGRFEEQVALMGNRAHVIRRGYEDSIAIRRLEEIPPSSIVFYGVPDIGTADLHVPPTMLETRIRREALLEVLCSEFTRARLLSFADAGGFTPTAMRRVQELCVEVGDRIDSQLATVGRHGSRDSQRRASNEGHSFARLLSEEGERELSKSDYRELLKNRKEYDLLVDGCAGKPSICRRGGQGTLEVLTPGELKMFTSLVRLGKPTQLARCKAHEHQTDEAARRMFKDMRAKVCGRNKDDSFICTIRGESRLQTKYAFDPPEEFRFAVLEPID